MKSISEYFEDDHNRLDDLFRSFQKCKKTDFPKAREFFVSFKFGLQRHIIWEEEILFPVFELKTGITSGGPTEVMRFEHKDIKVQLDAIHQKVKLSDPDSDLEEEKLLSILSLHNQKEEQILYPFIDRCLSAADVDEVFQKMQKIPDLQSMIAYESI